MKNYWQTGGVQIAKGALLPLLLAAAVFLFVVLLVYELATARGKRMEKTYPVSLDDARQIVLNVLDEKGLPYKETAGYIFTIEDEVRIQVLPSRARGLNGTSISLTPQSPESAQFVINLREKLDDAFRPRGL